MKSLISLKTCALLLGMGAALLLTPSCKAQSEVSPDHFDGTDSWSRATRSQAAKPQQTAANASAHAKVQNRGQESSFQLASSREVTKAAPRGAAVADRKRKATTSKTPEKK